jgi:hypothetical protein
MLTASYATVAVLACASCDSAKSRKATFPVEGKLFWKTEKTPAARALVVFRPVKDDRPEMWPDGFPRGAVGADGSFKLTTYTQDDGAPEGEYAVLVTWPRTSARGGEDADPEDGGDEAEDRLQGAYNNSAQPRWTKHVKNVNDPKDFALVIR